MSCVSITGSFPGDKEPLEDLHYKDRGSLFHPRRNSLQSTFHNGVTEEISLTHNDSYKARHWLPFSGGFPLFHPLSIYLHQTTTTSKLAALALNDNLVANQASKCHALFCQVLAILTSGLASPYAKDECHWLLLQMTVYHL